MYKFIFISLFSLACFTETETGQTAANLEIFEDSPEDESLASLDRTIANMKKMVKDMERMNRNLDAIFKAVTDCKTPEECESLKKELYEKHLEENKDKNSE